MCPGPAENVKAQKVQVFNGLTSDLSSVRKEYHFKTPVLSDLLLGMIRDPRDEPMVHLMLNLATYLVLGVPTVYAVNLLGCSGSVRHAVGVGYVVCLALGFLERFILMMHYSSHRSMFKSEFAQLNGLFVWCYAPFMGVPVGTYHLHHVVMHHIENNHGMDISATDTYQRDSLSAFFNYWLHFLFGIWVELPMYCIKSKRYQWVGKLSCGLVCYIGGAFLLARCVSFAATMYVFGAPYFITMSAMAFGNFSQHMFVDPDNSRSNYHLTYSCIDCPGNKTSFNDGYHVIHHANARLHWSELPQEFIRTQDKHMDSITFRGIHFFDVGLMVMSGNLQKLVEKHYVYLGSAETAPTVEETVKKLRRWLQPVPQEPLKAKKAE